MNGTLVTAGLVTGIALSVLLPIAAIVVMRRREGGFVWKSALVGALVFFVFAQVLEKLLHLYVFTVNPATKALLDNVWIYAFYGALAAGIFEEFGRYAGFKLLLKRNRERRDGMSFGIGHGGIEAILVGALAGVQTLTMFTLMQQGTLEASLGAAVPAEALETIKRSLETTPWWLYALGGLERGAALIMHIAFSLIVLAGIRLRRFSYVLGAAGLHAAIDFPVAFYQKLQFHPLIIEAYIVLVAAGLLVMIARSRNWRAFREQP